MTRKYEVFHVNVIAMSIVIVNAISFSINLTILFIFVLFTVDTDSIVFVYCLLPLDWTLEIYSIPTE